MQEQSNIQKSADIVRKAAAKAFPNLKEGEDLFHVAITLGSGLGGLQTQMEPRWSLKFTEVGFPEVTVAGHAGEVVFGELEGLRVVFFAGRVHSYEGLSWKQITYYVQLLAELKAGGIPTVKNYGPGTIMIMEDHLRIGARTDPCFPLKHQDDSVPRENFVLQAPNKQTFYDDELIALAKSVAKEQNLISEEQPKEESNGEMKVRVLSGAYAWWSGPSYETPSEIIFSHQSSANAVGMSTVPECLLARQFGISVLGFSLMTNYAAGFQSSLNHEEVKKCADEVTPTFKKYMCALLNAIGKKMDELKKNRVVSEKASEIPLFSRIHEGKALEDLNCEAQEAANQIKHELLSNKTIPQVFIVPKDDKYINSIKTKTSSSKIPVLRSFMPEHSISIGKLEEKEVILCEVPEIYLRYGFASKEATVLSLFFHYLGVSSVFVQILDVISFETDKSTPRYAGDILNFHDELKPWQFVSHLNESRKLSMIVPSCEKSEKDLLCCFNGVSQPTKTERAFMKDVFGAKMCCLFNPSIFYTLSFLNHLAVPVCSFVDSEVSEEKVLATAKAHFENCAAVENKVESVKFSGNLAPLARKNFKLDHIKETKNFIAEKLNLKPADKLKTCLIDADLKIAESKLISKSEIELDCSEIPNFEEFCFKGRQQSRKLIKFVNKSTNDVHLLLTSSSTQFFDSCFTTDFSFFVRVLQELKVRQIIILSKFVSKEMKEKSSNVSVICDHINLSGDNPLIGPHLSPLGPRFNDMSKAYCEEFVNFVKLANKNVNTSVLLAKGDFKEFDFPFLKTLQELAVDEKKFWKKDRKLVFSSVGAFEAITAGNYFAVDENGKQFTKMAHLGADVEMYSEEASEKSKDEVLAILSKFLEK